MLPNFNDMKNFIHAQLSQSSGIPHMIVPTNTLTTLMTILKVVLWVKGQVGEKI